MVRYMIRPTTLHRQDNLTVFGRFLIVNDLLASRFITASRTFNFKFYMKDDTRP